MELHGAHGFLIQNFLSPLFNQRADDWGGSLENRMRFPTEVVRAAPCVIATHAKRPFLVGYHISPEKPGEGGLRIDDALALAEALIERGQIDYLHASLYDLLQGRPQAATHSATTVRQFIERVASSLLFMAAGQIRTAEQARQALALGLPLVAVGRGLAMNPRWVELIQTGRDEDIDMALDLSHEPGELQVPDTLWSAIKSTAGWFPVQEQNATLARAS